MKRACPAALCTPGPTLFSVSFCGWCGQRLWRMRPLSSCGWCVLVLWLTLPASVAGAGATQLPEPLPPAKGWPVQAPRPNGQPRRTKSKPTTTKKNPRLNPTPVDSIVPSVNPFTSPPSTNPHPTTAKMPREVADIKKVSIRVQSSRLFYRARGMLTAHATVHRDLPPEGRFLYVHMPRRTLTNAHGGSATLPKTRISEISRARGRSCRRVAAFNVFNDPEEPDC